MPTKSEDKRRGKALPNPVTPSETVCFTINIPSATQYRAALLGVIGQLSQWYTWDHPIDGTQCEDCEEAAQLWATALAGATFSDDCEGFMSCFDVANCISTDALVQQSIINQVTNNPSLQEALANAMGGVYYPGQQNIPGLPLSPGKYSENLTPTEDCNFDVFWAQVDQFVEYLVNLGQDTLEYIAFYNTAVEAGQNAPIGGLLGKLKNGTTVGKVVEFVQWTANIMKSAYEAGNNETNRRAIKCALFCEGKQNDCRLSLEGAFTVLNGRLGGLLNPAEITSLPQLAEAMVAIVGNPALALDTWLAFLLTSARVAGFLGLEGINETMALVLAVAVNDASNDWEEFCLDCNEPVTDCLDFRTSTHDWVPAPGGYGLHVMGQGWKGELFVGDGQYYLLLVLLVNSLSGSYSKITLKFNQAITDVRMDNLNGQVFGEYTGAASNEITFDSASAIAFDPINGQYVFPVVNASNWYIKFKPNDTVPGTLRLQEICLEESL